MYATIIFEKITVALKIAPEIVYFFRCGVIHHRHHHYYSVSDVLSIGTPHLSSGAAERVVPEECL